MRRNRGLSLVEVLVSLVLLATTASLLLTAQAASLRQARQVELQEQAATLAGELIHTWQLEDTPPVEQQGWFDDAGRWQWRRAVSPWQTDAPSDLLSVKLTIRHFDAAGQIVLTRTWTWLEASDES
jgi:prepilin-type N-terminal cleavage/methylation domain-containing protein